MKSVIRSSAVAACVLAGCYCASAQKQAGQGIEKIEAYEGTWKVEIDHLATPYSKAAQDRNTLRNDCWKSEPYFVCNQYVDGVSKALLVFTYDAAADRYISYPIPADGGEAGKGTLTIQGNTWTYPWEVKDGDKTTYFRVVNVWTTPVRIEFRQEYSTDKVAWTEMAHGVETKTSK